MRGIAAAACVSLSLLACSCEKLPTTSFKSFDERAQAGERLVVVFFGASLTWGSNATDQALTSYRARVAERLEEAYSRARFKCYDAAIGGTGSELAAFRLDRDVLSRKPDIVFLDFTANDDIYAGDAERNASYESLVRRIVQEGGCPVVQMVFPFGWNVKQGNTDGMKRRDAHIAISRAYGTVVGDAVTLAIDRVKKGEATVERIWPNDMVHPGDFGYRLFADAAWAAYREGVEKELVCAAPAKMLHADTYMTQSRVRISSLYPEGKLPEGWRRDRPNLTAAWHDGLMSRWLDDVVVAANRKQAVDADGKKRRVPQKVARLKVRINARMVMLFGEETTKSGRYRIHLDGRQHTYKRGKETKDIYDASAKRFGGNRQHAQVITTGLDPDVEHTLEIEPVFAPGEDQELRIESICVAGGEATVRPAD